MPDYDVDYDDYEEREGGYDGELPKRGTYDAKLVSLKEHTSGQGNEGLEWVWEITQEPYAGFRGWTYSNMGTAKWKTQEYVKALQGGATEKMTISPAEEDGDGTKSKTVKKAGPVRVRIIHEDYEGEPRGRVRNVLPAKGGGMKKSKKKDIDEDDDPPF